MPPLIAWGVGLVGAAALARWAMGEVARINRELDEARMTEGMQAQPIRKLRRDPVTGVYRPE